MTRIGLHLVAALVLVKLAGKLNAAGAWFAERAAGKEFCHAGDGLVVLWERCPRCTGKGYHHGFGERGVDPDWCDQCGGMGQVADEITFEDARAA